MNVQQNFNTFHEAHPEIEKMFLKFSVQLRELGIVYIRADEILHRIRWELLTTADGLKLRTTAGNESIMDDLSVFYGNRYAMKLMTEESSFKEFFDLTVRYN